MAIRSVCLSVRLYSHHLMHFVKMATCNYDQIIRYLIAPYSSYLAALSGW